MPAAEHLAWSAADWEEVIDWQGQDRKPLRRIDPLTQDCLRNSFTGIGRAEPLRDDLSG